MKREIIEMFIGKRIVFKKKGLETNFIGTVKEVTDEVVIIDFRGRTQVHLLDNIIELEEALKEGD